MPAKHPKGVVADKDRHGNLRYYYRKAGQPKIRLRQPFDTDEFHQELACARLGIPYSRLEAAPERKEAKRKGSFGWLVEEYLRRAQLARSTRNQKRRVLNSIADETCLSQSGTPLRHMSAAGLQKSHVSLLRDLKRDTPEAANHRIKALSALFQWAIEEELVTHNPADRVRKFKSSSTGHHTLTDDELQRFVDHHPLGTKAYLAYCIFRYTGLRVSDAAVFGRQHLYWRDIVVDKASGSAERIRFFRITPAKDTNSEEPVPIDMPVLPPLEEALATAESGTLAFLVTEFGKPFSTKGLGNRMRKWFDEAGLPHCSSHGIRKADAVIAAENGATANELLSMFGWTNIRQAQRYTRAANRRKLAETGSERLLTAKKVGHAKT
ncbi:tyrosine-type recombinase/integrase [Roseibium sediminis]|uniref:tyrosine-type recombinase/integrase n=1 Tax=Roseibium sediminis TaxID=1775174 RepID=UPI00123E0315|nr:tyrosine-type recombinase/integrase [Roseibium sediminis]